MTRSLQRLPSGISHPLLYVAGTTLLVTILSLAQAVLMPLALAALIGFVLIAPVAALERAGLHRVASVALVLVVVLGGVAGFGYTLSRQFTDLAAHMPQYSASIKSKLAALRETRKGPLTQIQETVEKAAHDLDKQEKATSSPAVETSVTLRKDVQPVLVVPNQPGDVERLRARWEPVARPIATAGIVLILVIFILVQREDIRNRLIRLAGQGRLTITTRTLDEAAQGISRFLFSQSVINAAFGLFVAVGLLVIGIPYALLWGVAAAFLRFVPYLGTTTAMLMAAGLAFVQSDGWAQTLETLGLFWAAGLTAYVVDPIVNGTRTGISSFALLISAIFWTWLWGPVGLLLATPLTVCLVAIGRHVPEMEFLTVLLAEEPPLDAALSFYQRLIVGDEDEASRILDHELGKAGRESTFDGVIVPTLLRARQDRVRDEISDEEHQCVVRVTQEILRTSAESRRQRDQPPIQERPRRRRRLLGVPARTPDDQLALEMLSQLLGDSWTLTQVPTITLASELFVAIEEIKPDMLCIAALAPRGLNHTRYLCRQVHDRFPDVPIWVVRVGVDSDPSDLTRQLVTDGARQVVTSFTSAATQIAESLGAATERLDNAVHSDGSDGHFDNRLEALPTTRARSSPGSATLPVRGAPACQLLLGLAKETQ